MVISLYTSTPSCGGHSGHVVAIMGMLQSLEKKPLWCQGRSAGGLTMGAVATMRPDLWRDDGHNCSSGMNIPRGSGALGGRADNRRSGDPAPGPVV